MRQLQGRLVGSARRQDTVEDHRSPLSEYCERVGILPEEHIGFRLNHSTTDVMFVIRRLQELAQKKRSPLYVYFIDLTEANDSVDRTPPLDSALPFWRATEYDLGHSSIPRWHASMRATRRQGVLGVVRCGRRPLSRVRARAPPVQHLLRGGYKCGFHAFQGGQRHHERFGAPEGKRGARGRGEATVVEEVLATPLWGILYADDAGAVSQSPEQLRNMMGVIVIVCTAFGLAVSEAKTEEMMCLRAKGMSESTAIFSVEAAGQVYNQTNEFVYLGGNVNRNADLFIEFDRRIRNAWCRSGSTPSNCTTDRALPSSSKSGCLEPRYSRQC